MAPLLRLRDELHDASATHGAVPIDTGPESLPKVPELRWGALAILLSSVLAFVAAGLFGRVEVTVTAQGSLYAKEGPRRVLAQSTGRIGVFEAEPGQVVRSGQVLARIEAHELAAQVERRQSELDVLRQNGKAAEAVAVRSHDRTSAALHTKRSVLLERAALAEHTLARETELAVRIEQATEAGVASANEAIRAGAAVDGAKERLLMLRQELTEVSLEVLALQQTLDTDKLARELAVKQAEAELAEARTLVKLTEVRAPQSGRLESLMVSAGQVVRHGDVVARIVPERAAPRAVVFVAAKDATGLAPGVVASLEFPSRSITEYGKATAIVTRVGHDVALEAEVAEIAPEQASNAPLVRVELDIVENSVWQKLRANVRSGERLVARCHTDRRRIATLVFDFLRESLP